MSARAGERPYRHCILPARVAFVHQFSTLARTPLPTPLWCGCAAMTDSASRPGRAPLPGRPSVVPRRRRRGRRYPARQRHAEHGAAPSGALRVCDAWHAASPGRSAPGDFIVAGLDFGGGAATQRRRRARCALLGVGAVIARCFGAEFFARARCTSVCRRCRSRRPAAIKTGDRLRVDIEGHKVVNLSSGDRYVIRNIYGEALDVLRAGGMARIHGRPARPGRDRWTVLYRLPRARCSSASPAETAIAGRRTRSALARALR